MNLLLLMLSIVNLSLFGMIDEKTETRRGTDLRIIIDESPKLHLNDTTVKFLWRDMKYDPSLDDTISSIFVNQEYLKIMTDPEKAAIGYVATFIGNECMWEDDEANDDLDNLDCKVISALGLGYQCSDKHLGFLRKWFSTDNEVLLELEKAKCPIVPYTATIQNTFVEIILTIKNDSILVFYKASGADLRELESWRWSETVYFKLTNNNLILIKKEESDVKHKKIRISE